MKTEIEILIAFQLYRCTMLDRPDPFIYQLEAHKRVVYARLSRNHFHFAKVFVCVFTPGAVNN